MVDINKLRAEMVLKGFKQKSLVEEMNARGYKITENTLSAKMNGRAKWDTDDADIICEILGVEDQAKKADIFLA